MPGTAHRKEDRSGAVGWPVGWAWILAWSALYTSVVPRCAAWIFLAFPFAALLCSAGARRVVGLGNGWDLFGGGEGEERTRGAGDTRKRCAVGAGPAQDSLVTFYFSFFFQEKEKENKNQESSSRKKSRLKYIYVVIW